MLCMSERAVTLQAECMCEADASGQRPYVVIYDLAQECTWV